MELQSSSLQGSVDHHDSVSVNREDRAKAELTPRVREYFDARERQAQGLVRFFRAMEEAPVSPTPIAFFDRWAMSPEDVAQFERYLADTVSDLSPEARNGCLLAWCRWSMATRALHRALRARAPELGTDDWRALPPEVLGRRLFHMNTKQWPEGRVSVVVRGPFLMVALERSEDWRLFNKMSVLDEKDDPMIAGYMARKMLLYGANTSIVTGMAFSSHQVESEYVKHEIQHFVNHRLASECGNAMMEAWEPKNDRPEAKLDMAQRAVKDELLAFLRDGRAPNAIDTLLLMRYQYLFENAYENHLVKLLGNVVNALNDHPLIRFDARSEHFHARELLVASLLDVPLHKMEHYLKLSAKYYRERLSGKYGAANHGLLEDHVREMPRRERYFVDSAEQEAA